MSQPVPATICETREAFDAAGPGAIWLWRYSQKEIFGGAAGHVLVKCPGCGSESAMHVRNVGEPHPADTPSWEISGLPFAVTFHPSVNCVGCCKWHGWLKAGVFAE